MTNSAHDSLNISRAEAKRLNRSFKAGNAHASQRVAPYFSLDKQLTLQQAQLDGCPRKRVGKLGEVQTKNYELCLCQSISRYARNE